MQVCKRAYSESVGVIGPSERKDILMVIRELPREELDSLWPFKLDDLEKVVEKSSQGKLWEKRRNMTLDIREFLKSIIVYSRWRTEILSLNILIFTDWMIGSPFSYSLRREE
jgi:hypothetical protein